MRRFRCFARLLLLWLLTCGARGDVADLLAWQRQGDSGAFISSGFYDWRGPSKYRSRPGLHAGYDIAMLAGSRVRTPWPGEVVAITPWYGEEFGVTLRLPNGLEATFGHIAPSVSLGQVLARGAVVGRVVVDHVDVKVRNASGYVDFGVEKMVLAGSSPPPSAGEPVQLSVAQRQAAAEAYARYGVELERLARDEAQIRWGLLSRARVQERRERLQNLRPLARIHAELVGKSLPRKPGPEQSFQDSGGRPVADFLLEVSAEKSERVSPP